MTEPADRDGMFDPRVATCTWCGPVLGHIPMGHCDQPELETDYLRGYRDGLDAVKDAIAGDPYVRREAQP